LSADLITEKLSFHVRSFQESFEILCSANSIFEMGKHFERVLSGSFFTTSISLFHSKGNDLSWENLLTKNTDEHLKLLCKVENELFKIYSSSNSTELFAISNLVDSSQVGIVLGKRFDGNPYTEIDKITFQIFIQLFDNAYQALLSLQKEKKLIFSLNNRVSQLYSLIDTGIELSKIKMGRDLMELALSRAIALTNASYGRARTVNTEGNAKDIFFPPNLDFDISQNEKKLTKSFKDEGVEYEFSLCEKESRQGIIEFDETDDLLLGAIARQVQAAIENDRANKEALENETMKRELEVAAEIQRRILPVGLPEIEGYDIAGINIPSKGVSGDYYNVFKLDDGRFALIVADVTGKGMPASLLVSTLDASLRSYLDFHIPLSEMAVKMNSIIYKSSTADKFITFLIAVLDPSNGEIDIINAGHNPALLLRKDDKMELIEAGGVAFGMFDMGLPFEGKKLKLEKGERLFIFSDGIPEAMNKDEEEYSDEKLEKFFVEETPETAEEFINAIVTDVKLHTKGEIQSDDITAIYLIRK
jgi:sigma-B regulation protein RsbU (phosphoserine phosphatase)